MSTKFSVLLCFPDQTTKRLDIPSVPSDSDRVQLGGVTYGVLHPTWVVVDDEVIVKVPLRGL
jgi:hypothetical protein